MNRLRRYHSLDVIRSFMGIWIRGPSPAVFGGSGVGTIMTRTINFLGRSQPLYLSAFYLEAIKLYYDCITIKAQPLKD